MKSLALTSLLFVGACVTNLSYRYDPNADGASSGSSSGQPRGSCKDIVLLGGDGSGGSAAISTVFKGAIANDQIHWTVGPALPYPSSGSGALLVRRRVFVAGGSDHLIQYTSLDGDSWQQARKLPGAGVGCTMASLFVGQVHMVCVTTGNQSALPSSFWGPVDDTGDILWVAADAPTSLAVGGIVAPLGDHWLVVTDTGTAELGKPNPANGKSISWTPALRRPVATTLGCAVGVENRAYFISGKGTTAVAMATLSGDTVTWSSEPLPPLPEDRATPACIYSNGRIWVLGGTSVTQTSTDTVYSAPVTPTGLGPWELAKERLQNAVSSASVACLP